MHEVLSEVVPSFLSAAYSEPGLCICVHCHVDGMFEELSESLLR